MTAPYHWQDVVCEAGGAPHGWQEGPCRNARCRFLPPFFLRRPCPSRGPSHRPERECDACAVRLARVALKLGDRVLYEMVPLERRLEIAREAACV